LAYPGKTTWADVVRNSIPNPPAEASLKRIEIAPGSLHVLPADSASVERRVCTTQIGVVHKPSEGSPLGETPVPRVALKRKSLSEPTVATFGKKGTKKPIVMFGKPVIPKDFDPLLCNKKKIQNKKSFFDNPTSFGPTTSTFPVVGKKSISFSCEKYDLLAAVLSNRKRDLPRLLDLETSSGVFCHSYGKVHNRSVEPYIRTVVAYKGFPIRGTRHIGYGWRVFRRPPHRSLVRYLAILSRRGKTRSFLGISLKRFLSSFRYLETGMPWTLRVFEGERASFTKSF